MNRHLNDRFVIMARNQRLRSRAAFKLLEIQREYKLFGKNSVVIDIGSAPGSWSQILSEIVTGECGRILAIDKIDLEPLSRVKIMKADIFDSDIIEKTRQDINYELVDSVISDASPNISGICFADHINSISLALRSLEIGLEIIRPRGSFVSKIFRGPYDSLMTEWLKLFFDQVYRFKPSSSRAESREIYFVAKERK